MKMKYDKNNLKAGVLKDWSSAGINLLVNYIEEFEKLLGLNYNINPDDLRFKFSEYNFTDLVINYAHELEGDDIDDLDDEETLHKVNQLKAKGIVIAYDSFDKIAVVGNSAR
jgi:hypothetical protein